MTCPFTEEALPDNDLEVAVVFGVAAPYKVKNCGHEMSLEPLMDAIANHKGPLKCPVCKSGFVISVADRLALTENLNSTVIVRFGTHNYFLTVPEDMLAQSRVQQVLGVPDLKILFHGKIIYPSKDKSEEEMSEELLKISQEEMSGKKRPTMVVMGKRTGQWGAQGGHLHK